MTEKELILQIARLAPNWFIRSLVRRYPLNIPKFEHFMPWFLVFGEKPYLELKSNDDLKWSMETFLKYQSILGLDYLSQAKDSDYEACNWWIPELYEKHPEYYTLPGIAGSENYWDWDAEKLEEWAPQFDSYGTRYDPLNDGYYSAWRGISSNSRVQWTPELLERYADQVDWVALSESFHLPWSEDEILRFENRWSWSYLTRNYTVIWTPHMIRRHDSYIGNINTYNPIFAYFELVQDYAEELDWRTLPYNKHICWNSDLMTKYWDRNRSAFSESQNLSIPWSAAFIERYAEKIDFKVLSLNPHPGIPWSEDFIRQYSDRLSLENLLKNPAIPWSEKTLEKYAAQKPELKVWERVSRNQTLNWSLDFLDKHRQDWDWSALIENPAVSWSLELILEFISQVQTVSAPSRTVEILWKRFISPHLDDAFLMNLLEEITPELPKFSIDLMR